MPPSCRSFPDSATQVRLYLRSTITIIALKAFVKNRIKPIGKAVGAAQDLPKYMLKL